MSNRFKIKWFDYHPFVSDLILLLFPGMSVFLVWLVFDAGFIVSLSQGILVTIFYIVGIAYLMIKNDKKIFRTQKLNEFLMSENK